LISQINPFLLKLTYFSIWSLALFSFVSLSATALSHILIVVPGLVYFIQKARSGDLKIEKSSWALIAMIVVGTLSILNAPDVNNKVKMIFKLKYLMIGFLAIFPMRELFKTLKAKQVSIVVSVFLVLLAIGNIAGIYALFSQYHPLRMKPASDPWRAAGMYGMAITYGYGIELILILMTGLAWVLKKKISAFVNPYIFWVSYFTTVAGFYFAFARGAMLAFIFSIPFLFIKTNKKIFLSLLGIGTAGMLAILLMVWNGSDGGNRFFLKAKTESNMIRLSQYEAAVKGWLEKPLLGWGYRNFEPNAFDIKKRNGINFAEFYGHAHNNYLEYLASTGIFGFLSILLFVFFWFWEVLKRSDHFGLIMVPLVVSFAISGLFQNTINDGENMFVIMFLYSLTQALNNREVNFGKANS
jgi:O-antigen ligase